MCVRVYVCMYVYMYVNVYICILFVCTAERTRRQRPKQPDGLGYFWRPPCEIQGSAPFQRTSLQQVATNIAP